MYVSGLINCVLVMLIFLSVIDDHQLIYCYSYLLLFTKLFSVSIRPHLEYASVLLNSYNIGLYMQIEQVQKRFTRRIFGRNALNYDNRTKLLKIPSLTLKSNAADMIFVFKLFHNYPL